MAALYLAAAFLKTTRPMARLADLMPWTTSLGPGEVRLIGVAELLGVSPPPGWL